MGCKLPFETIEEKPWDWKELSHNADITTQDVLDDSDYSDTDSEYVPSENDDDDDDKDFDDYVDSDSDSDD